MEDGCLDHPGASTSTASLQIEYRPYDWQIPATQPPHHAEGTSGAHGWGSHGPLLMPDSEAPTRGPIN